MISVSPRAQCEEAVSIATFFCSVYGSLARWFFRARFAGIIGRFDCQII